MKIKNDREEGHVERNLAVYEIAHSESLFNAAIVRDILALRIHSINLHSNLAHDIMTVLV